MTINDGTKSNMILNSGDLNELDFYHNVWQFHETAKLLARPHRISSGYVKGLWVPHMCLLSFSCELEIKFLYYKSYNKLMSKNHHDLLGYFNQLPDNIKIEVIKIFCVNTKVRIGIEVEDGT